jgi:CRP-like cAMP-binding protein
MPIEIEKLKMISYFKGLDDIGLQHIKDHFIELIIQKGEVIEVEEEKSVFLYFVIAGIVKVFKTSYNGKVQVLHFASDGDPLNDISTFDDGLNAATMLCLTNVSLYAVKKEVLKTVLLNSNLVCINIIESFAKRARRDASLIQELHAENVPIRLARLLLGSYAGQKETVANQLSQNDMACVLGACREVVNRSLRLMEKKGAIKVTRSKTVILNKRILSELSQKPEEFSYY